MKKKQLIQELYQIMDMLQEANDELGSKIANNEKLDAFKDTQKFNSIRSKIVSIKNRVKQSDVIQ
jgi:hypothetical protein